MNKTAEWIESELEDILGDSVSRYVISNGRVVGPDGLIGAQLIANCLYENFDDDGSPNYPSKLTETETTNSESAMVKKRLRRLAKKTGGWFVVCYQLHVEVLTI